MDFFCIPIICGCQTRVKPEGDQSPRICPRCHNAAVTRAKRKEWFELCFVPLIPLSSKHIWLCSICQWSVPQGGGWEPQPPNAGVYNSPWTRAGPAGQNSSPYAVPPPGYK